MTTLFASVVYLSSALVVTLIIFHALIATFLENKKIIPVIGTLSILLFVVRLGLVPFKDNFGVVPYLNENAFGFYICLMLFGIFITLYYVFIIEKVSFEDIGLKKENLKKGLIASVVSMVVLGLIIYFVVAPLAKIEPTFSITAKQVVVAFSFTILAIVYEEVMFRGIIQNHVQALTENSTMTVLLTSTIFTATHLFYLPFTSGGLFYYFVLLMAIVLSVLRAKYDNLLACAIVHGGVVWFLVTGVSPVANAA